MCVKLSQQPTWSILGRSASTPKGLASIAKGLSVVYTDLAYLDEVKLPCDVCGGRRFKEEVLRYKLNGRSVADVLSMTVSEAIDYFGMGSGDIVRKLQAMSDVGWTICRSASR